MNCRREQGNLSKENLEVACLRMLQMFKLMCYAISQTDHHKIAMYLTRICFILLLTCFDIFTMKDFPHVNTLSRSTSLVFVISPSPFSLHFLWSSSFAFGNFHIPTPLVLLLVPQPNMKQLSPGMTIFDKLTANSTVKTRIFDSILRTPS